MKDLHQGFFDTFRDGRHGRSMVAMHKEKLLKELEDETVVNGMMPDVGKGACTLCHRDFDSNARDLAKLSGCGECHRRKTGENAAFITAMAADMEQGRCTVCHGDFDKNAGEQTARLGHCAECHRTAMHHDFGGRTHLRPCMGCHHEVLESAHASLPNTSTCAACHQPQKPPLGKHREEQTLLAKFVEPNQTIPWRRVYDYLPSEIVFSHERHVEIGRVACSECHGAVDQAERPLTLDVKLSMEACMNCHEAAGADNDCTACHR
jgi:hypothetical protein